MDFNHKTQKYNETGSRVGFEFEIPKKTKRKLWEYR